LKSDLDLFFASKIKWNVLMLQGLNYKPYKRHKDVPWVKVSCCEAPGCYLVHCDYFETLLENYESGYSLLEQSIDHPDDNPYCETEPYNFAKYSLDMYWKLLQETDNWFLPRKLTCVQENSYSDIDESDTPFTDNKEARLSVHQNGFKDVALSKNEITNSQGEQSKHVSVKSVVRKDLKSSGTSSSVGVKRKLLHVHETEINSSSSSSGNVGVVGSKQPKTYKEQLANYNAAQLAKKNLVVVLEEAKKGDVM